MKGTKGKGRKKPETRGMLKEKGRRGEAGEGIVEGDQRGNVKLMLLVVMLIMMTDNDTIKINICNENKNWDSDNLQ